jgi:alanine dehydrogenase
MSQTIILSRKDVSKLLTIDECLDAVEGAFRMYGEGRAAPPKILGLHAPEGGLHIKAGMLTLNRNYIVAKMNSNFAMNPTKHKLPTIQGAIAVFDADNGMLLSVMDSIEVTIIRTGAATGVAAKYLAKESSETLTICGCGNQGLISLRAILYVRKIKRIFLFDTDQSQVQKLSRQISHLSGRFEIITMFDLKSALRESDIIVTCTPSRNPFVNVGDVRPGTFIAAVGADSEHKHEIHPALIKAAKIITDLTEQSATIGDLHHAIEQGFVTRSHVHAELGEVLAGKKSGREDANEVIVFDSTGTALQDVAAAAIVYERAVANEISHRFCFSD